MVLIQLYVYVYYMHYFNCILCLIYTKNGSTLLSRIKKYSVEINSRSFIYIVLYNLSITYER